MRRVVFLLTAGFAACSVDLHDVPGRACDDAHSCKYPRTCQNGFCLGPGEDAGGGAGGGVAGGGTAGGAGGGSGGGIAGGLGGGLGGGSGGGTADAGAAVWQQRLHGFSSTTISPNTALTIDSLRGNLVSCTIRSARDGEDRATADMVDPARLPTTLDGRFRGRVTLPAAPRLSGFSSFAWLGTQTGIAWVELGFDEQGNMVVSSDPGTLTSGALTERYPWDGGFQSSDYVVDVSWKKGQYRRVSINGVQVADTTIAPGGSTVPLSELRLGIGRYDGDAGTGWTVYLSAWQLAADPLADLGPL